MIDYEYFDSVDDTENKKDVLTTNDNSNIMDKIHATITKTFTLLPSLKTIIIHYFSSGFNFYVCCLLCSFRREKC